LRTTTIIAALALSLPLAAAAQEAAPNLENPRAPKFSDVERGFFLGFEAGVLGFGKTPTQDPIKFPYAKAGGGASGGLLVGASLGYDVTNRIALSLFALGGNERASVDYGAFSLYAGGLDLRVSVYGVKDRNDWERFFVYVHGRGGVARTYPSGLFGTSEVIAAGGPGIEYYTRLRHFSVGLAADYVFAAKAKTSGYALYPTVRYTF
jgi:hypothetical protein